MNKGDHSKKSWMARKRVAKKKTCRGKQQGLNGDTERAMMLLVKIYEKYEDVTKEMVDVDHEVEQQTELIDEMMEMVKQTVRPTSQR